MQALLSFDQSPPLSAPLRFFFTAPVFGLLAGALMLWQGPDLFASRWTPAALALTHLITVGFMLQVMVGAMLQLLPVVAGANIAQPRRVATVVHASVTLGTLVLVAAFLTSHRALFGLAALLLGGGVLVFMAAAGRALRGVGPGQTTVVGMKLALFGLGVTVSLGAMLALSLGRFIQLPVMALTHLHMSWGLLGWGGVLLAAIAYVVVPMFQMTPPYPGRFSRWGAPATVAFLLGWTAAEAFDWAHIATLLRAAAALAGAALAAVTLATTLRSKRAQRDPTQLTWQLGMACLLAASLLWLAAATTPVLAFWAGWPLLWGVLVLWGGFVSVMVGMLYKIVPFLVWLHLRRLGQGKVHAPNMKLVLPEPAMRFQVALHALTLPLLILATVWPAPFAYAAGVAVLASNAALLRNLMLAMRAYRQHLRVIADSPPRPPRD
jgi:hypothetical protein